MKLLAIIPCRMGESEIPHKCTRQDTPDGISLLTRAMHFAHELTDYVLVTTPRQPPVMPLKRIWWRERPQALCGPDVPMRDVVNDALKWWDTNAKIGCDKWVLLQPTTPSRTLKEVAVAIMASGRHPGITATVDEVPAEYSPDRVRWLLDDGQLFIATDGDANTRQAARKAYRRNGVAYVGKSRWMAGTPLYGVITNHHQTLDTLDDWAAFMGFSHQPPQMQPSADATGYP